MHLLQVLLWISLAFEASLGHNFQSVYIKSPLKQLVTSNSLRWEYVKKPHDWVKDTRVVLLNEVAACKGTYKGVSVIGSAKRSNGHCYVELNGSLHSLRTKFYVLIQRIKASRLIWSPWNIFTKIPNSSVAYNLKTYVARSEAEGTKGHFSFGSLDPNAGLSGEIQVFGLFGDRKLRSSTVGAILVEHEPVRYELKKVDYIERRRKILNESSVTLGSKTFINAGLYQEDGAWSSIRSVLSYNTSHTYNWGQLWGLITALPSRGPPLVEGKDDFPIHDFEWGLPLTLHKHQLVEVSRFLQAKTAAKCVIRAEERSSEVPYRAELISIYEDGSESSIWIEGTYSETILRNVEVVFDDPYFIKNGSAAPTTTTTTTTTTAPPPVSTTSLFPDGLEDTVFKIKNPRHANNLKYGQDIPRGERYYSLTSSTTTRNPLYRFYPPEEETEDPKTKTMYSNDPKTFSLTNSSQDIHLTSPHILILLTLLCYICCYPIIQ